VSGCDGKFVTTWHTTQSFEGFGPSLDLPLVEGEREFVAQVSIDDGVELEGDGPRSVSGLEQEPEVTFHDGGSGRHDLLKATMKVSIGDEGFPISEVGRACSLSLDCWQDLSVEHCGMVVKG